MPWVRVHVGMCKFIIIVLAQSTLQRKNSKKCPAAPHAASTAHGGAGLTRHICSKKTDGQAKKSPLVALRIQMLRRIKATMESKFMTCCQGGAERREKVGGWAAGGLV